MQGRKQWRGENEWLGQEGDKAYSQWSCCFVLTITICVAHAVLSLISCPVCFLLPCSLSNIKQQWPDKFFSPSHSSNHLYVSQVCRLSSAGILNIPVLGHLVGQAGFSLVFSENLSLTYLILQSDEGVLAMPHGLYDETAYEEWDGVSEVCMFSSRRQQVCGLKTTWLFWTCCCCLCYVYTQLKYLLSPLISFPHNIDVFCDH